MDAQSHNRPHAEKNLNGVLSPDELVNTLSLYSSTDAS